MSIIIRLQNLPLEANSLDIRRFFQGLHIPDGGVHIVGGENGDAFIAFGTDEDARQAMGRDGNMIKGSHIKLLLSSRNEMQRVIENARTQTLMMGAAGGGAGGPGQGLPGAQPGVLNNSNQTLPPKPGVMPPGSQVPGHYQVPPPSQQQPPQYAQQPPPGAAMNKPPPMYGGPGIPGGGGSGGGQVLPPYASSGGGGYPGPGSSVPQQQGPLGGYGMSSHSPSSSGPSSKPPQSDPFHDRTRYRSRSRSPPPSRIDSSNSSGATAMHSGLIGSLQQSAYGSGPTNGSAYSSANNSSSGPYDSGNAPYSSYQRPYQGPGDQGPPGSKYDARSPGSGPSGWNSNSSNNPSHLMANQAPPSNYPGINNNNNSSSNDYRSGYPPPSNKDQQHGPYGSGQPLQQQPAYVSNNQMAHSAPPSHQPYSNEPPSMQPPPSSGPPMPPGPGSQSSRMFTLQLSNLPLSVRVDDLLNFFQPLYLHEDNVKIFYDEKGFPTGIALVRFPTPREFETALGYSSKMMSDRQIQIRPLDDMNGPPPSASSQGPLPGGATSAYPSPAVHQPPPLDPPAYSTNNSYPPAYSSNDNYRQAPSSQQQGSSPYGQQQGPPMHQQQHQPPGRQPPQSQSPPNKELVLFMKGLPYSNCTPHDVAKFFESIVPYNIEIEADSRGKPTGNAFVEFKDRDDYERAMEYNMRHMGRRYIELIPLVGDGNSGKYSSGPPSSGHHNHHPSGRYGPPPRGGATRGDSRGGGGGGPSSSHTYCISVKGLPPDVNSQHLKTFFGEVGARPFAVHVMLTPNQMNAGEAFVEFVEQDEQRCALKRDGDFMGPNRIGVRTVPYEVMMNVIKPQGPPMPPRGDRHGPGDYHRENNNSHPKSRGDRPYRGDKERGRGGRRGGGHGGGGGGGDMGHGGPARSMSPRKGAPPFSDNSCTLLAMNVSFKATDDDLCVFFSDYGIVPERVHRRLNEKGATIEAQISFFTKADAEHALRNMDNKYFLGRNIHLKYA